MVSPYVWCPWGNSPVDVTPPKKIGQNCHDGFLFFQCFSNIRVQDSDHAIAIASIYIWSKRSQSSECVCESKRNFKADKTYLLFTEELHRQTCTWTCSWFTLYQVGHGVQFNGPIIMICIKKIWVLSLCWAPITSFLTFVWWCFFFIFSPHDAFLPYVNSVSFRPHGKTRPYNGCGFHRGVVVGKLQILGGGGLTRTHDPGTWELGIPWRGSSLGGGFASMQMGYFKKEKDRFPRIMFQEFWQETLQAWLHLGECWK